MNLIFAMLASSPVTFATQTSTDIPKILGCPAYLVIKDKAPETGEVRWLTRATKENCVYADVTGKTDVQSTAKPKR